MIKPSLGVGTPSLPQVKQKPGFSAQQRIQLESTPRFRGKNPQSRWSGFLSGIKRAITGEHSVQTVQQKRQHLEKILIDNLPPQEADAIINRDYHQDLVEDAAYFNNLKAMELLCANGATLPSNILGTVLHNHREGSYKEDKLPMIQLLVNHKAEVNGNFYGRLPLVSAALLNLPEISSFLMDNGSKLFVNQLCEQEPLVSFAEHGQLALIDKMSAIRPHDDQFKKEVENAILTAGASHKPEVIKHLITKIVPAEERIATMQKLVMPALTFKSIPMGSSDTKATWKAFQDLGLDFKAPDEKGYTLAHKLAERGNKGFSTGYLYPFAKELGVPLDEPAKDGNTPLLLATLQKDIYGIIALRQQGADPLKKNKAGFSALDYAKGLPEQTLKSAQGLMSIGFSPSVAGSIQNDYNQDQALNQAIQLALELPLDDNYAKVMKIALTAAHGSFY